MDIAAVVTIVSGIVSVVAIISSPLNSWIRCRHERQLKQSELFFNARSSAYPLHIAAVNLYIRRPSAEQYAQTEHTASAAELYASTETMELISDLQRQMSESLLHLSNGFINDVQLFNNLNIALSDMIFSMQNDLRTSVQNRR